MYKRSLISLSFCNFLSLPSPHFLETAILVNPASHALKDAIQSYLSVIWFYLKLYGLLQRQRTAFSWALSLCSHTGQED